MALPPCPFERAILSTAFVCRTSQRQYIAEKEAVTCTQPAAQQRCKQLVAHFRQCAGFALPGLQNNKQLPHGQEMKLKAGGLNGIRSLLELAPNTPCDIKDCLDRLEAQYGQIESISCQALIRSIQAYQGRRGTGSK
jgi:hypothetical protein